MLPHALAPKKPRARTSVPTKKIAPSTIAFAPPGKLLIFAPGLALENIQMKTASRIWDARKEIPASAIVSDICSSIGAPCVEISGAIHHVCRTMGIADRIAITIMVTAKNLPMSPSLVLVGLTSGDSHGYPRTALLDFRL